MIFGWDSLFNDKLQSFLFLNSRNPHGGHILRFQTFGLGPEQRQYNTTQLGTVFRANFPP